MATPADLVRAYGREYDLTRRETRRLVDEVWREVGGADDSNLEAWLRIILPIMNGAEMNVANLVTAYLDTLSSDWGIAITPRVTASHVTGPAIRNGATPEQVYARPVIATRKELARGRRIAKARDMARNRARVLADTDLALAHRFAAADAFEALGFEQYKRVPTGRSCDLCRTAAENTYNVAQLLPIHPHCDCRVIPVSQTRRIPSRELPEIPPPSAPAAPVVREHGELGPVLVDRSHSFTGPGDLDQ
jgi:hypothetical protein